MTHGPFRILYLKEEVRRGSGDSHYLVAQAEALAVRGHHQAVLTGWTDCGDEFADLGIPVYLAPFDNREKGPLNALRAIRRIREVALDERADILHAHHRWPGLLGWIASRTLGVPIVSTDHTDFSNRKFLSFRGEGVLAVSEFNREHLMRVFHVPPEKITVVGGFVRLPSPAEPSDVARLRAELALDTSAPCIVNVAQLQPVKNQALLLAAFALLLGRRPWAHLLVAGDGPLGAELDARAKALGVASRVHWLGLRADVTTVLGLADVFVMSSATEGAPLAMLEAMALGVPVVTTAVGGVPDLLDHGTCGLLVPPGDAPAMADAVDRMLSDEALRGACVDAARTRVRLLYDQDALAEKVEAVYARVYAMRPARRRRPDRPAGATGGCR